MALSAAIAASSSGDNTIVVAVAAKKIRVKAWELTNGAASAQNAKWKSGASTDLTGLFYSTGIGPMGDQDAPTGDFVFETAVGQALVLNLSAATAVGGVVDYTLE